MNSTFAPSRYAGVVAMAVWSLGWIAVAFVSSQGLGRTGRKGELDCVVISVILSVLGLILTARSARAKPTPEPEERHVKEPLPRRLGSWLAAIVWCGAGFLWNVGMVGTLLRAAYGGQSLTMLILIPFSLIGLFLLLVTFTSIGVALDYLLHALPGQTAPTVAEQPLPPSLLPQPAGPSSPLFRDFLKKSPILGTLVLISFLNWFMFFGITMYFGGDALGTLPSRDGFVVTSHGHQKAVSESVWLFSLFYTGATLLLTPLVWLAFAARQFSSGRLNQSRSWKAFLIGAFILVWVVGWYSSVGNSFRRSLKDWKLYDRENPRVR